MSKYAAKIELGWIVDVYEADVPCGIIRQVENVQDFGCLMMMGREEEGPEGQKQLDKLEEFLNKYYGGELTMEDIKNLDVHLSIGDFRCLGIAEGEAEIKALTALR